VSSRGGDDGLSSVELAVLMPVLLFWMMLIVQFGLWYHAKHVASAAADVAVDTARVPGGTARAAEAEAAAVLASAGNLAQVSVAVDRQSDRVLAEVTGAAPRLVPGLGWRVTVRASGPVERFAAGGVAR
jgi:Flp pilus assembly protein TadG